MKQVVVDKWKRKVWYNILAPKMFSLRELGTTPASKESSLINRTIVTSLGQLTGQRAQKHIDMIFRINSIKGTNAYADIEGHEIKSSYLNRLISRRKSKIDVVLTVETADNKKVKINAMTLTGIKLERKKETKIRKIMHDVILEMSKKVNYDVLVQEMVFGNMASEIFKQVKDISPIKKIEIVKSRLLHTKASS